MLGDKVESESIAAALAAGYTSKNGLLWHHGKMVNLPTADHVAHEFGWVYVEHMVKALKGR